MVAIMTSSMRVSKQAVQSYSPRSEEHRAISCTICSAQFAPTQAHAYLLQAPRLALESAYMSMCHFCFRCRRPACPLCWDDVHGLCGSCVADVQLPFRQEAEPLPLNSRLLIPTLPRHQQRHATSFPLVSIYPGRFQSGVPVVEYADAPKLVAPVSVIQTVPCYQEARETPIQAMVEPTAEPERKHVGGIAQHIERSLTLILGLILSVIAILIVIASFSPQANQVIAHVLHVDIRMEIAYLLQIIQQLYSGG